MTFTLWRAYLPGITPNVKHSQYIFGANALNRNPNDVMIAPEMATVLVPNRCISILAKGPKMKKMKDNIYIYILNVKP